MFKAPDAKRSLAAGLAAGVAMMSVTASATAGGKPIPVNPHWYWPTASDFADAGVIIDQGGVVRSFGPVSVPIPALEDAVSISGAPGNGGVGVLFRDGSIQVFSPSAETSQVPLNLPPTRYLMLEEGVGMAIDRTGVLRMWGRSQFAGFGNPGHLQVPSDLGAVRMTRQQNGHVVALKVNGTVRAWGLNSSGQSSVPGGLIGVVKVSAGKYHTLALRVDGDIVGWGSTSSAPPGRYLDVAAGHSRSFAIREDGAVVSFGSSDCNTGVPPVGVLLKQLHDDYGLRGGVDCSGLCHSFQTCLPFVPPNTYVFTYPSICDTSVDFFSDCDGNAEPDFDQVMNAPTLDGNSNGILDSCETPPDCDANGIPDATEIADGMPDVDGNGVPDNCQCLADVNETGNVNGIDLAIVLGVWGTTGSKYPTADINQDGVVNAEDLGIVLAGWGPCP